MGAIPAYSDDVVDDLWRTAGRSLQRLQQQLADEAAALMSTGSGHLGGQAKLLLGYLATALAIGDSQVLASFVGWLLPLAGDSDRERQALGARVLSVGELAAARLGEAEAALVRQIVARALDEARRAPPVSSPDPPDSSKLLLAALLAGDRAGARRLALVELDGGLAHLYEGVITPALAELGRLWYQRRISVAEEHLATALAQSTISSLYPALQWPKGGPRAVLACVGGEQHAVGARMAADLLGLDGWEVAFLGPDVPSDALAAMMRDRRPQLAALSVTIALHMTEARTAIAAIRAALPGVPVLVGGRATAHAGSLDADAVATSASQGVAQAARWKG